MSSFSVGVSVSRSTDDSKNEFDYESQIQQIQKIQMQQLVVVACVVNMPGPVQMRVKRRGNSDRQVEANILRKNKKSMPRKVNVSLAENWKGAIKAIVRSSGKQI